MLVVVVVVVAVVAVLVIVINGGGSGGCKILKFCTVVLDVGKISENCQRYEV